MSQRTQSRSARRNNFVKENSDDESVEIDASAVATEIHLAKEMDDDESQSSFGSRKKKKLDSLKRDHLTATPASRPTRASRLSTRSKKSKRLYEL